MAISLRPMKLVDIPQGMRLSILADWNQTEVDWQMLYYAGDGGCFCVVAGDMIIGTVTTVTYSEKISWIGMVLVDPEYRRQGIGRMLVNAAVDSCRSKGYNIFLDATPLGRQMYDQLGFTEIHMVYRLCYDLKNNQALNIKDCQPLTNVMQTEVLKFDEKVFGAQRKNVFPVLWANHFHLAYCSILDGELAGFCLGREGRQFTQIGPVQAVNGTIARQLVLTGLANSRMPGVILDVPDHNQAWLNWLKSIGFSVLRPFVRMGLNATSYAGQIDRQYAIAGPEIG